MLKLSARRLFAAKVIERPQGFLRNNGFSPSMANTIVTEKVKNFNLGAMEKLCLVLNCTPHDFLVWEPDASITCLLYTSPSPRDRTRSRMPSSA